MKKITAIIARKPLVFLIINAGYIVSVGLLKWYFHPPIGALWFLIGAVIGVYLLDAAEVFVNLTPSPFRTVVFAAAFLLLSLFILSSSNSLLADGLVLTLYLSMILWQIGEWQIVGNVSSWYHMIAGPASVWVQRWGMILFAVMFIIDTIIFLRWA